MPIIFGEYVELFRETDEATFQLHLNHGHSRPIWITHSTLFSAFGPKLSAITSL
jgi:hypothetical protein